MTDNAAQPASDSPLRSASATVGSHLLGRLVQPDPRDWSLERLFAIAEPPETILDQTISQVLSNTSYFTDWHAYLVFWRWLKTHREPTKPSDDSPAWTLNVQLDQGQTNHCVGFGWSGWADSLPIEDHYQNGDANTLYYECKVIDGEPHAENGSTVRSGALALRKRGRLAAFAFAKSTDDIDSWINTHGPVVVGTTWTDDMFNPDADGLVKPTGKAAGGHCYVMIDRLDDEDAYLFQNSWGSGWGLHGRFKIKRTDFAGLLADQGEACCAAELPN